MRFTDFGNAPRLIKNWLPYLSIIMLLDFPTIFAGFLLTNIAALAVMVPLWLLYRNRYSGIGFWLLDYALQVGANGLNALRKVIPEFFAVSVGNALFFLASLMVLIGLAKFLQQKFSLRLQIGLIFTGTLGILSLYYLVPGSVPYRSLIFCGVLALQIVQMQRILLRVAPAIRPFCRPLLLVGVLHFILLVLRILQAFRQPAATEFFQSSQGVALWVMGMQLTSLLIGISLYYLVFARLSAEVVQAANALTESEERHRQELEALVKQRTAQLMDAEKLAFVGTLSAGVAHEINNPNQAIALNLPVIRRGIKSIAIQNGNPEIEQKANRMVEAVDACLYASVRIGNIASELKSYAIPAEGRPWQRVDLRQVCELSAKITRKYLEHLHVNLQMEIPAHPLEVMGDITRLEQILINLLRNSAEAFQGNHRFVYITMGTNQQTCFIKIRDTGVGMSADHLAKAITPFFTTHRDQGGTGLGLWIAHQIAEEHGGHLELLSEQDQGTQAILQLPCINAEDAPC